MILEIPPLLMVGVMAGLSLYVGKLAKYVHLPSILGYMVVGIFFGESVLSVCGEDDLVSLEFITQLALGFVGLTIGMELSVKELRRLGPGIGTIIISESLGAFVLVFAVMYLVTWDLPLSLIFAAMAPASAPAGTVAVIRDNQAKGKLTTALYAVVGFDDGLALLIFGFAFAAAKTILESRVSGGSGGMSEALVVPVRELLLSIVVGGLLGLVFGFLSRKMRQKRDIFILAFSIVLIATGLSEAWHLSLILTNMLVGFAMVNTRTHELVRNVGDEIGGIMPLIFVLFFSLAGAHLKISTLSTLGALGAIYIVGRSAGLLGGAFLGAVIGKADKTIKKYIGLGILSQAGVAIGLALIVKREFANISPEAAKIGSITLTTVTATCIFFEIIGPILTKVGLSKAGEIPKQIEQ